MVSKTSKKKVVKPIKRQPSPASVLKKVSSVSDSNKALQKEIKVMSKIFGENQKVLVSMKGMIYTLTSTLEHIQKQSLLMHPPQGGQFWNSFIYKGGQL